MAVKVVSTGREPLLRDAVAWLERRGVFVTLFEHHSDTFFRHHPHTCSSIDRCTYMRKIGTFFRHHQAGRRETKSRITVASRPQAGAAAPLQRARRLSSRPLDLAVHEHPSQAVRRAGAQRS